MPYNMFDARITSMLQMYDVDMMLMPQMYERFH